MAHRFQVSQLVPDCLAVESVTYTDDAIVVTARAEAAVAACPLCGSSSRRVHSRYVRRAADLPCSGRRVCLRIVARRFMCQGRLCPRRIFSERFSDAVLATRSRRTARLECIVHHLGLALGGRPGAGFARRLMLPISNDTLLRVVRRRLMLQTAPLTVVGIDEWAFRRNCTYGTIVCDLERRRIVKLLPDREPATVEAFLTGHPEIAILSRDRGGGYREAAKKIKARRPARGVATGSVSLSGRKRSHSSAYF